MKLNLDFTKYIGKTLLKDWWPVVLDHIRQIQNAINTNDTALTTEMSARQNADTALGKRIDTEIADRKSADTALGGRIDTEASERKTADTALEERIDNETAAREAVIFDFGNIWYSPSDNIYVSDKAPLSKKIGAGDIFTFRLPGSDDRPPQGHGNSFIREIPDRDEFYFFASGTYSGGEDNSIKVSSYNEWTEGTGYLALTGYAGDGLATSVVEVGYDIVAHIDASDTALREDVTELQGKSHTHTNKSALDNLTQAVITNSHTHVNKTLLDGVTAADIARWNEHGEVPTWYRAEVDRRINEIIEALGVNVYDGGYFGDNTVRKTLDGGLFGDDTPGRTVDGGDFGPLKFDIGEGGAGLSDRVSTIEETLAAAEVANVTLADEAAIDAIFDE